VIDELNELRRTNIGDKTAVYLLDWLYEAWLGRFDKYAYLKNYFERREKMLKQLLSVYPDLKIQAEDFKGRHTKEVPAKDYWFLVKYAPIIHYKKLPNEIVIEIDNPSREELKKVLKRLRQLDIEPLVCWSGNKSWHVHILTFPEHIKDPREYVKAKGVKEFTDALYKLILREVNVKGLDEGVQLYSSHWIRSPYSLNVNGRKVGIKKPLNGDLYRVWFFSHRFAVMAMLFVDLKRKEVTPPTLTPQTSSDRWRWIENLLKNPEKVKDGRERLLWLAIVPYLVLQGYSDAQIEDICRKWIEKTGETFKSKYRCKVRSMIKHCREHERKTGKKWYPISKSKLLEMFPDLRGVVG